MSSSAPSSRGVDWQRSLPRTSPKGWLDHIGGRLQGRRWAAQDGTRRYEVKVVASEIQFTAKAAGSPPPAAAAASHARNTLSQSSSKGRGPAMCFCMRRTPLRNDDNAPPRGVPSPAQSPDPRLIRQSCLCGRAIMSERQIRLLQPLLPSFGSRFRCPWAHHERLRIEFIRPNSDLCDRPYPSERPSQTAPIA